MMHLCHEDFFLSFANSADPDKMVHYVPFHLGLHCLLKYLFAGIQNEKDKYGFIVRMIMKNCLAWS